MNRQSIICITCPIGCHMEVSKTDNGGWLIEGNKCKRGEIYATNELTSPTRILTTTVKVENSNIKRLPVKSKEGIPKDKVLDAMTLINKVTLNPPIKIGDVIIKDILNTGVDIIATRSLP